MKTNISNIRCLILTICLALTACDDFVNVDLPTSQLASDAVFENERTALAAANGMYESMLGTQSLIGGQFNSLAYIAGLSADELIDYTGIAAYDEFYKNQLVSTNSSVSGIWSSAYITLYRANLVIEGVTATSSLPDHLKKQLVGEGKFVRALCHFYLVNLFGDIPLVVTSDYRTNATHSRTPETDVYQQIIDDLLSAKELLTEDYYTTQRTRPNRFAAAALLSRVYLYMNEYQYAETEATYIINATSKYRLLSDLSNVFLSNSGEAILQLSQVYPDGTPAADGRIFYVSASTLKTALSMEFVDSFEAGDLRKENWITSVTRPDGTFYRAYKYKLRSYFTDDKYPEQLVVLRLAEIYLIRSEARAALDNVSGSQDDLNKVRNRAGLPNTTASDKSSLLQAVLNERRMELFCELGHRWLDLKRTNEADAVLSVSKADWSINDQLYPLPASEITNNPRLDPQNPGY